MNTDWVNSLFSDQESPSVAIVVAHPDDEVIGCGAQLPRWPEAHVIHLTDGAPRHSPEAWNAGFVTAEEYAAARERESMAALALAGLDLRRLHQLGFGDQEASLNLIPIAEALAQKFFELQPQFVITHAYEGGHPDHDATAFATHAAREIVLKQYGTAPILVEAAGYFNRAGIMATSEFLPRAKCFIETRALSEPEREFKARLFSCFKTQQKVLQYFPIATERFRLAPDYDFSKAPHAGRLHYELLEWGMTGGRWRKLALGATGILRELSSTRQALSASAVPALHP